MFLRKRLSGVARKLVTLVAMLLVLAAFIGLTQLTGSSASSQGLAIAGQSVRRAAVQCYALEGSYPPSYEYLRENGYGAYVDETLYFIDYQFLASNLMPDITVLPQSMNLGEGVE